MTDRDGFARLLTAHQRAIYTCVRSLLHNREGVDEVWQDTNVVLWQKSDQFRPGTNFRAWALAVARFEVQNFRRRCRTRARVLSDAMIDQLADELLVRSEAEESRLDALRHCLTKLPPRDRELIHLRYQAGMGGAKVAEQLGRSLDAIYRSVTRIRGALLECVRCRMAQEEHA
jgi:RNA polymerase sigma-70 factor (ECF subfamily)